jgi:hypothetical protein
MMLSCGSQVVVVDRQRPLSSSKCLEASFFVALEWTGIFVDLGGLPYAFEPLREQNVA